MDEQRDVVPAQGGAERSDGAGSFYTLNADAAFGGKPPTAPPVLVALPGDEFRRLLEEARFRYAPYRRTNCRQLTDDEWETALTMCVEHRLSPLLGQICFDVYENWRGERELVKIVKIAGLRTLAARSGEMAGIDVPAVDYDDDGIPLRAVVRVWRFVRGERVAFDGEALWSNYYPGRGSTWDLNPELRLGTCAEALALRKAYPNETGGIYTPEELAKSRSAAPPRKGALPTPGEDEPQSRQAVEKVLLDTYGVTDSSLRSSLINEFGPVPDDDAQLRAHYANIVRVINKTPNTFGLKRITDMDA